MEKPQPIWRYLFPISVLAGFAIVFFVVFEIFNHRNLPANQVETGITAITPTDDNGAMEGQTEAVSSPYPSPYPPPGDRELPYEPLGIIKMLASKILEIGTGKAAALYQGHIWLVQSGQHPKTVANLNNVAVIFGWSHDGSKVLFGQGLHPTFGELSDATELMVYDTINGETRQLSDSRKVWSASWSPVDDRIAYCEYGYLLTVISVDGVVLGQQENVACDFTWSPDGSGIALAYSSPDMVLSDGLRTTALAVWWLEKDELQLLSDAKFNDDSHPIWSIDSQRLLFYRVFSGQSEDSGIHGLYVFDLKDRFTTYLSNGPEYYPSNLSRSPRSDTLVFTLGQEIYMMEFDGKPVLIGEGKAPTWLSVENSIIYLSSDRVLTSYLVDTSLVSQPVGGGQRSIFVQVHPYYIFFQEGQ